MYYIKQKNYEELKELLGKKVHFVSNCELFPNFDVIGKVISINYEANLEIIFNVKLQNGKTIDIGSNMKNLRYEIL